MFKPIIAAAVLAAAATPVAAQDALARRVQLLEDREAIHSVLERFFEYQENGDTKSYAGLFAKDGELHLRLGVSKKGPDGTLVPVARAAPRAPRPAPAPGATPAAARPRAAMKHILSNPHIEVKGDTAKVESRWTMLVGDADGRSTRVGGTGRYFDDFVREGGIWKIKKREIDIDIPVETDGASRPGRETSPPAAPAR
jgi:hypothetical protein